MRRGELSAREVMTWHLERIEAVNPRLNAIVTLRPEAALAQAAAADERAAKGGERLGPLHGLPIAIKDLEDTAGPHDVRLGRVRRQRPRPRQPDRPATEGRRGDRDRQDEHAGVRRRVAHVQCRVGPTRNPWGLDRSPGGSSGGAGAALAAGLIPIADGSDHGGSIRNPASFNSVVGLRPTPGLVPDSGDSDIWDVASVVGPMARTVGDLALMLTAISGPDPRSPLSYGDPATFAAQLSGELAGLRVAWCPDLGGLPIESEVLQVLDGARAELETFGCHVDDVDLDLGPADEAFETLRAVAFVRALAPILPTLRRTAKATLIWNIEQGMEIDGPAVARAVAARSAVFAAVAGLLERFDLLVAPAAQVVPFAVELEYPSHVAGVAMPHYLGWMRVCSRITVSAHPVVAVPAGFTASGLPVGMQFVGRYRDDRRLLEHGAAWEAASGLTERHPRLD